jgi:hypothetical protein
MDSEVFSGNRDISDHDATLINIKCLVYWRDLIWEKLAI